MQVSWIECISPIYDVAELLTFLIVCTVSQFIFTYAFTINYPSAVLDLAKIVKGAVQKQGMLSWQYNTIGISDGITMGGEGRFSVSTVSCQNTNPKLIPKNPQACDSLFRPANSSLTASKL